MNANTAKAKRGLGRGLDALFEDEEGGFTDTSAGEEGASSGQGSGRRLLGIDQLQPSNFQPRTLFDEDSLKELADSIKKHGLLQPVIVRGVAGSADQFEIIAGERRWRAAQKAGLHEVPAIVMDLTDEQAIEIALIENLQREDLNPVDEAMGYKKLIDVYEHTQESVAESLGKSRSYVANMVRLLTLPDVVLGHLERGDLSVGHARALITAENPEGLAREIVSGKLSVREAERRAAQDAGRAPKKTKSGQGKDTDTLALEKEISNTLGMRVSIDSRDGKSGKISISFKTLDQLDDLIRRLS